jgi:hypothetical protein
MILSDDFDWTGAVEIIVREQQSVAVYPNGAGGISIRQEKTWDEEGDSIVMIRPEYAEAVARAILSVASGLLSVPSQRHALRDRVHGKDKPGDDNTQPLLTSLGERAADGNAPAE